MNFEHHSKLSNRRNYNQTQPIPTTQNYQTDETVLLGLEKITTIFLLNYFKLN